MGYVISGTAGTNSDGTYIVVRDTDTNEVQDKLVNYYLDVPHTGALPLTDSRQFTPSGAVAAQLLKDPLWYAAKYGGFEEAPATLATPIINHPDPSIAQTKPDYRPLLQSEWDKDNDGNPDTYFYVTNPLRLEVQLKKSFADILKRKSSGTAASVISNSRSGEGAVYQSIFYPWNGDNQGNTVTWVGDVNALLVDVNGNLREDSNGDHKLNVVSNSIPSSSSSTDCGDMIVVFDNGNVSKYKDCNGNSVLDAIEKATPFITGLMKDIKINYLWTAGNWLNNLSDPATQRTNYTDVAASATGDKRYIFTFVDTNKTMIPASPDPGSSQLPFFSSAGVTATKVMDSTTFYPYLNVYPPFESGGPPSYISAFLTNSTVYTDFLQNQTRREIDYIRGVDQDAYPATNYTLPKFRSRKFDYNSTGNPVTWRLGDIDYSTPTIVGKPSEGYHLLYSDYSYADFLNKYLYRRNVVYVGGNDGMLHAFNAGFYKDATKQFNIVSSNNPSAAPFPLGAELWAYVPYNLLPHLFWLTDTEYAHVYYVDQKPRVFDARIFFQSDGVTPLDASHPNGWGTVMVVGMRFGGGTVNADLHKAAGNLSPVTGDPQMSSAFIVMDITDPETPPRLLAELKLPGLGYTTCYPAVIPMGAIPYTTAQNDWYLIFGSGPVESDGRAGKSNEISLSDAASGQSAKLFVVDLKALAAPAPKIMTLDGTSNTFKNFNPSIPTTDPAYYKNLDTFSFISDPTVIDYQMDYKADAVYFGTVAGDSTNGWSGKLRRIVINNNPNPAFWNGDSVLLDTGSLHQPIVAAPNSSTDGAGNRWIYFGTGRLFVNADKKSTAPQSYYGIKETFKNPATALAVDWPTVSRTNLQNVTNVKVFGQNSVFGVVSSTTKSTWNQLTTWVGGQSGWELDFNTTNGERNVGQAALLGSTLIFTTYRPPSDVCDFEGESFLYALYYTSGTAYFEPMIGLNADNSIATNVSLGDGLAATPNIHVGGEEGSKAFIQTSTGEIKVIDVSNATATKSGMKSWRLFEQ
jgi:type IV pilus assembly protein PilY1